MRLILGSQSPRRKEILEFYSIPFLQMTPPYNEEQVLFEGDPIKYVLTLAEGKAASLAHVYPSDVILTADTVVFKEGKIFNKPADEHEQLTMLATLNGSWHSVFTAVTARKGEAIMSAYEETRVQFHHLNDEQLTAYHQVFKGKDKAGGYGIQKGGSVIVKRIEGCFYNVMGLPVSSLHRVLYEMGIDLWRYLRV